MSRGSLPTLNALLVRAYTALNPIMYENGFQQYGTGSIATWILPDELAHLWNKLNEISLGVSNAFDATEPLGVEKEAIISRTIALCKQYLENRFYAKARYVWELLALAEEANVKRILKKQRETIKNTTEGTKSLTDLKHKAEFSMKPAYDAALTAFLANRRKYSQELAVDLSKAMAQVELLRESVHKLSKQTRDFATSKLLELGWAQTEIDTIKNYL